MQECGFDSAVGCGLDHDRHGRSAIGAPLRKALESIEDFELTVIALCDTQRHGREIEIAIGARAAEPSEGSFELFDLELPDKHHDWRSSIGRI